MPTNTRNNTKSNNLNNNNNINNNNKNEDDNNNNDTHSGPNSAPLEHGLSPVTVAPKLLTAHPMLCTKPVANTNTRFHCNNSDNNHDYYYYDGVEPKRRSNYPRRPPHLLIPNNNHNPLKSDAISSSSGFESDVTHTTHDTLER